MAGALGAGMRWLVHRSWITMAIDVPDGTDGGLIGVAVERARVQIETAVGEAVRRALADIAIEADQSAKDRAKLSTTRGVPANHQG